MTTSSTTITLQNIHCTTTSESPRKDELYIKYSADGGKEKTYPDKGYYSIDDGGTWETDLPMTFKDYLVVSLFDADNFPNGDDNLGSHTYHNTDPQPASEPVNNNSNGARYTLNTVAG